MGELSDFNTVLNQVLELVDATTKESALAEPGSVERHQYEGRIAALNQVISFFLEIGSRKLGANGKPSVIRTLPAV